MLKITIVLSVCFNMYSCAMDEDQQSRLKERGRTVNNCDFRKHASAKYRGLHILPLILAYLTMAQNYFNLHYEHGKANRIITE